MLEEGREVEEGPQKEKWPHGIFLLKFSGNPNNNMEVISERRHTHTNIRPIPTDTLQLPSVGKGVGKGGTLRIVYQYKVMSQGQLNNNTSNTFKSTSPLLVGEISDSRTGEGNLHDEPRAFCSARK